MAEGATSPQGRPADSAVPGRPHGVRRKKAEGALEETQGGFWLRQKQNFKGNRNCGSFKDPLQDQLTPTNVYLSSHFMMALH